MLPLSLANAMTEPEKVMAPMATPRLISIRLCDEDRARLADVEGLRAVERRGRNEHRCQPDEAVERGHQLRHRGHRDAPRDDRADDAADGEPGDDQSPGQCIAYARDEQRRDDGDDHADHAVAVAVARAFGRRQAAQRENEQHARDEIGEGGEIGVHRLARPRHFFSFFLYIASMRWVTRKPPKMFTEARISAAKPRSLGEPRVGRERGNGNRDQRADDDHRRDRIGHAHQRRVQRRRHAPHHVVADEDRQHENRQAEDERDRWLPWPLPISAAAPDGRSCRRASRPSP